MVILKDLLDYKMGLLDYKMGETPFKLLRLPPILDKKTENDHKKLTPDPKFSLWFTLFLAPKGIGDFGNHHLGGGFKHFLFSPLLGEMIQFD